MPQRTEEEICQIGLAGILDINDPKFQVALEERSRKGNIRVELDLIRKDGSSFPVDFTSVLTQDKQGKFWATTNIKARTVLK